MAKKMSLLEKFEIEIEKLDYSYIESCENGGELEKIYKILVSNEEGYYPDLTEAARRRLQTVKPTARCLRTEEKLLKRDRVESAVEEEIKADLKDFLRSMKRESKEAEQIQLELPLIPIRKETSVENVPTNQNTEAKIEEITVERLTENQLRELQCFHRNKGNNFYRAKEFHEALFEYSKGLELSPNPNGYNNRAITYMKLRRYDEALADLDHCLQLDPENIKALMRKGDIYLKIHKKHEALGIYEEIQSRQTSCGEFVKEQIAKLTRELNVKEKEDRKGDSTKIIDKSTSIEDDFAKLIVPKNILPSKSKKLVESFKEMNKSSDKVKETVFPKKEVANRLMIEEI